MIPFANLPGAVLEGEAVEHFGQPLREQRAFASGALVSVPREVLQLTGPDRHTWLDAITSQRVAPTPGESLETLVLSPQGRIEHALKLVDDGESLWCIVDRGAEALTEWLLRMRFTRQVEITPRPDLAVVGVSGDHVAPESALATWNDPWPGVVTGGVRYGTHEPDDPWRWQEAVVPREASLASDTVVGHLGYRAARIAAGRPAIADTDERSLPHELDWLATAVHLEKGCYRGQETVAKVHNLGSPPRRLTLLHLDGSEALLPAPGAEVHAAGAEVGRVTEAALHHELGPIALALIKRQVPTDAELEIPVDGGVIAAAQEVLVPPTAGRARDVPKLPRLGAVTRPRPTAP